MRSRIMEKRFYTAESVTEGHYCAYFLINVVFPEPRKPVIRSIFTIVYLSLAAA